MKISDKAWGKWWSSNLKIVMRTKEDRTPSSPLSPEMGEWRRRVENMATLWESWRDLVFSGKASASICKKRDENFSEASEDRGEFANHGAQLHVNFGKWLEVGGTEISLVKGREPTRAAHHRDDDSVEMENWDKTGQELDIE